MPHQLTIRYNDDLARKIEELAEREGISRNQAVLRLLRKAVGVGRLGEQHDVVGDSLDWFIGSWSEAEAREFDEAVAEFEQIDHELWE
ncbi:MAG: ribbon-helix-helix domain-containing protein [Thermoanaerobaculia bacterium]